MSEAMNPTASPAGPPSEITDKSGRRLRIKKLELLQELDLIEMAGAEASANKRWMMLATLACCVTEINGVPEPFPRTKIAFRALVKMVGADGIAAVAEAFSSDLPDDGEAREAEVGAAKN